MAENRALEVTETDGQSKKRIKTSYSSTIKVLVGKQEQSFIVYEDLICANSRFFKAVCSKEWLEAQTRTVRLPRQKPTRFKFYLDYIYNETINIDDVSEKVATEGYKNSERGSAVLLFLCQLWILADYLQDVRCQNTLMVLIRRQRRKAAPTLELANWLSENSHTSSKIFKWIIDDFACAASASPWMVEAAEEFAPVVRLALLKRALAWSGKTRAEMRQGIKEHAEWYMEAEEDETN